MPGVYLVFLQIHSVFVWFSNVEILPVQKKETYMLTLQSITISTYPQYNLTFVGIQENPFHVQILQVSLAEFCSNAKKRKCKLLLCDT